MGFPRVCPFEHCIMNCKLAQRLRIMGRKRKLDNHLQVHGLGSGAASSTTSQKPSALARCLLNAYFAGAISASTIQEVFPQMSVKCPYWKVVLFGKWLEFVSFSLSPSLSIYLWGWGGCQSKIGWHILVPQKDWHMWNLVLGMEIVPVCTKARHFSLIL